MTITIRGVTKSFDGHSALRGLSLEIPDGTFVALLGPSGSGKTTLLRIIAGLAYAESGDILFDGDVVTNVPVQQRNIGFVFQNYALFRHMTVAENITFGLDVMKGSKRPSKQDRIARADELLSLVRLEGLGKRYPAQLSGGQRQRVALARALARKPRFLLLDEPFGALDAKVRQELRAALRLIHDQLGLTSIFVTHDRDEAFALADRIAILNNGGIEQYGSPDEISASPATDFVRDFLE
ncbi:MAG: sulfate/molybdate ABC transporter ATP-binding protein [Sphingomonadaceae bacterium]